MEASELVKVDSVAIRFMYTVKYLIIVGKIVLTIFMHSMCFFYY